MAGKLTERIPLRTLLMGAGLALGALILLILVFVYLLPGLGVSQRISRVIPLPVALVGFSGVVTTQGLGENLEAIKRFYESQDFGKVGVRIDFSTDDGKKRLKLREKDLLNKMIEDKAIRRLAEKRGIEISPDDAQKGIEDKVKELGTGSRVEQSLARLYGWTVSDFGEKVVLPSLYEEKLLESFQSDDTERKAALEKMEKAKADLSQGEAFPAVAQAYSEGKTAADGGELGWFALEDLAPELQLPVEKAKKGVPTDIVESELGYHILLVEDSKLENGKRLYHLKQVFFRKPVFADWLSEEMRRMNIRVFSRDYRWNAEEAKVEFQNKDLKEFERKLLESAEGDPSLLL